MFFRLGGGPGVTEIQGDWLVTDDVDVELWNWSKP